MYDTIDLPKSQALVDSSTSVTQHYNQGANMLGFCNTFPSQFLVSFGYQHLYSQQHQSQGTKYKKQLLSFQM